MANEQRTISLETRFAILERDRFRCSECGGDAASESVLRVYCRNGLITICDDCAGDEQPANVEAVPQKYSQSIPAAARKIAHSIANAMRGGH